MFGDDANNVDFGELADDDGLLDDNVDNPEAKAKNNAEDAMKADTSSSDENETSFTMPVMFS